MSNSSDQVRPGQTRVLATLTSRFHSGRAFQGVEEHTFDYSRRDPKDIRAVRKS